MQQGTARVGRDTSQVIRIAAVGSTGGEEKGLETILRFLCLASTYDLGQSSQPKDGGLHAGDSAAPVQEVGVGSWGLGGNYLMIRALIHVHTSTTCPRTVNFAILMEQEPGPGKWHYGKKRTGRTQICEIGKRGA